MQLPVLKVFWFRRNALLTRWREEVCLLHEEMRRTARYFKYRRGEWEGRAKDEEANCRWGNAGYSRMQARTWDTLLKRAVQQFEPLVELPDDIHAALFD